ncbi:unnamed protein product [Trichogramma brassicae]|uniref:Uncharacterized protein n=1 Tax=Trichogramma brassicae TaxID=86971 RepID=A0A6H5I0X3_9HYME|nr:unnamed protein product [Trichogramma brassicae]
MDPQSARKIVEPQPSTERFRLRARAVVSGVSRSGLRFYECAARPPQPKVRMAHADTMIKYSLVRADASIVTALKSTYTRVPHILFLLAAPRLECAVRRLLLGCRAFQCDVYDAIRRSNYMMCALVWIIFSSKTSEPQFARACSENTKGATSCKNTHAHIDSCGFARSPPPDDMCIHYTRAWIYRDAIRGWR